LPNYWSQGRRDNEYARDEDPETTFLCKYRSKSGKMQLRKCGLDFRPPTDEIPPPRVYNASLSPLEAFLIDLDGTVYRPGGLVDGAKDFYDWMLKSQKTFMFLSNTGAKTGVKTKEKLQKEPYKLADEIDRDKIHTAAEAQISMMADTFGSDIPPRLFVISGFPVEADTPPEWETLLKEKNSAVAEWDIRTAISLKEAQQWGVEAESHPTYVVMFIDGPVSEENPKPTNSSDGQCCDDAKFKQSKCEKDPTCKRARDTCACYESDWSFMLVRKIAAILGPGKAKLAYTADDAFNPSKEMIDGKSIVFPLPGPGMFGALLEKMMYPYPKENILVSGKGGNMGPKYMFDEAIRKLQIQSFKQNGRELRDDQMAMIGDRYDTDIRGAVRSGISSILVTSGAHQADQQDAFGDDLATWSAADLGAIAEKDHQGSQAATTAVK
jgi:ribonucleotide monophosphatase NagD (HAD superfamily)